MCGRYSLYTEEENQEIMRIVRSLEARYPGNAMKRGEIFPTNVAPILCAAGGMTYHETNAAEANTAVFRKTSAAIGPANLPANDRITPELSTWGFPRFGAGKGVVINARSETADERSMFKKSLHTRRCVIPTTGFFEWTQTGPKTKYRFNLPEDNTLYLAGLYNIFQNENKYVILTTVANQSIVDVHNRMPVILTKNMIEDWILSEDFAVSYLHANMPVLRRELSV